MTKTNKHVYKHKMHKNIKLRALNTELYITIEG